MLHGGSGNICCFVSLEPSYVNKMLWRESCAASIHCRQPGLAGHAGDPFTFATGVISELPFISALRPTTDAKAEDGGPEWGECR